MAEIITVNGLADAKRALEALTKDLRNRVVRGALRDAAKPIVQQAKANAPVRTGLVKRRITVNASRLRKKARGEIGVYIRPRATALARRTKLRSQDPFYYKFQEAGFHATGRSKLKNSRNARFIEGKAFLGSAFESRRQSALAIFQAAIKRRIDEANRRK